MTLAGRVSPFGHLRIKARLPAPRSLSQATASFIACNRQGIHHVHLVTCPYNVDLWGIKPKDVKASAVFHLMHVCFDTITTRQCSRSCVLPGWLALRITLIFTTSSTLLKNEYSLIDRNDQT